MPITPKQAKFVALTAARLARKGDKTFQYWRVSGPENQLRGYLRLTESADKPLLQYTASMLPAKLRTGSHEPLTLSQYKWLVREVRRQKPHIEEIRGAAWVGKGREASHEQNRYLKFAARMRGTGGFKAGQRRALRQLEKKPLQEFRRPMESKPDVIVNFPMAITPERPLQMPKPKLERPLPIPKPRLFPARPKRGPLRAPLAKR